MKVTTNEINIVKVSIGSTDNLAMNGDMTFLDIIAPNYNPRLWGSPGALHLIAGFSMQLLRNCLHFHYVILFRMIQITNPNTDTIRKHYTKQIHYLNYYVN